MASGDVTVTYSNSTTLTQTNLDGLTTSATWVAGWESDAIDNSSTKYEDIAITATIKANTSAPSAAAQARMYLVAENADGTWPDVFDGTESTETVTATNIRDAICRLAAFTDTDTTASRVYYMHCPSVATVFGGFVPRKFVIFITHSMSTALATSSDPNQVYWRGMARNVAP